MNIYSPAIVGPTTSNNSFTGTSFIKTGGTSTQFLMADGSVITNPNSILITEHSNTDFDYTPVWSSGSGLYITAAKLKFNPLLGRLSATSFLKIGGTSAQILTADGGIKVLGTGATDAAAGNHLHTGVYEPVITAGTTAQYWRGDKTWQTLPSASVGTLITTATTAQATSAGESFGGNINLHKVSKTGTYSDLIGTPTIPTVTPSALTRTNDTNVTLTLGGTPTTALLQATSITVGWTGTLADGRIASAGTWNAKEPGLGNPSVSGYILSSTTAGVRSWVAAGSTDTYPTTFTWTGGTTAGPTGSLTGTSPTVSFAAIPAASNTTSGIVTTGVQTFAGAKTFNTAITVVDKVLINASAFGYAKFETTTGNVGVHINNQDGIFYYANDKLQINGTTGASVLSGNFTATSIIKSGGTNTQYLMADGSVSSGTGSTPPGGISGNIQYNNAGAFAGFGTVTSTDIDFGVPIKLEYKSSFPTSVADGTVIIDDDYRACLVRNYGCYSNTNPISGDYLGTGTTPQTLNAGTTISWLGTPCGYYQLTTYNSTISLSGIPDGAEGTFLFKQGTTLVTPVFSNTQSLTHVIIGSINNIKQVANSYSTVTYKRFNNILTFVYGHQY